MAYFGLLLGPKVGATVGFAGAPPRHFFIIFCTLVGSQELLCVLRRDFAKIPRGTFLGFVVLLVRANLGATMGFSRAPLSHFSMICCTLVGSHSACYGVILPGFPDAVVQDYGSFYDLRFKVYGLVFRLEDFSLRILEFRVLALDFAVCDQGFKFTIYNLAFQGLEFSVQGLGLKIKGLIFRVQVFVFTVQALGCGVQGLSLKIQEFRVYNLGFQFRIQSLGFRVQN